MLPDTFKKVEKTPPEMLFLFPNFENKSLSTFTISYHLGTSYILAYLKQNGILAQQFIYKEPIDLDTLTDKILQEKAQLIGFTCYDTNYYIVKLISQLLKKKNPKLTILAGGPTATFSDKLIMQDNPSIDICVRGEGEYTVYELLQNLSTNQDISNIQGITYRSNGKLIQNPDRPLIIGDKKGAELDILPSPYLENIFKTNESFGILASRGCIFRCTYCNFSAMSRWTIRYHSVERVISELKIIYRILQSEREGMDNRLVEIWDDTFSLNTERAKQICKKIIKEKIHLQFWTHTRADRVDRGLLRLMYQAGFVSINFGLESAVPRVLYTIKKAVREHSGNENNLLPEKRFIEKVKKSVRLAKKIGIEPAVNVIMGLPGSSIKNDRKTIEFIKQLKVDNYYHDYLMIYPGTELFRMRKKYGLGIRQPLTVLPYQTKYAYDVYKIPEMRNSVQMFTKRNLMEKIMRVITGNYADSQGDGYPDLLFRDYSVDSQMLKWLRCFTTISPVICLLGSYSENGFTRQNIKKIISSGLPAVNFYLINSLNEKNINSVGLNFKLNRYEVALATEILTTGRRPFSKLDFLEFVPFASYSYNCSEQLDVKKGKGMGKMVFTLSTLDDIVNFKKLISHSERVVLDGALAKFDCCFLDACRWSDKDCPITRFRRVIIEEDGSIFPCFNSKPIAKVGQQRKDIIEKVNLLWNDMKKKRCCNDCPARDNCSKCLFPYPMDSREYCKIRSKSYPHINRIFKLLDIVREIRLYNNNIYLKPEYDRIVGVFDSDLVLVNINEKRYLYDYQSDELLER